MVSPAGFEPATPELEEPHSGVFGDASMPWNPCASTDLGLRNRLADSSAKCGSTESNPIRRKRIPFQPYECLPTPKVLSLNFRATLS